MINKERNRFVEQLDLIPKKKQNIKVNSQRQEKTLKRDKRTGIKSIQIIFKKNYRDDTQKELEISQ